jgi:cytochrome subunit of sulfide dehydrogenase
LHRPRRDRTKEQTVTSQAITLAVAALAAMGAGPGAAQSGHSDVARNLAATCAGCHGTGGASQGVFEGLAGMDKDEIIRKMRDFKTGARPATVMHQLARGYTDQQIELIAGWYATQPAHKE